MQIAQGPEAPGVIERVAHRNETRSFGGAERSRLRAGRGRHGSFGRGRAHVVLTQRGGDSVVRLPRANGDDSILFGCPSFLLMAALQWAITAALRLRLVCSWFVCLASVCFHFIIRLFLFPFEIQMLNLVHCLAKLPGLFDAIALLFAAPAYGFPALIAFVASSLPTS